MRLRWLFFSLALWLLFSGPCSLCEISLQACLDSSLRKVSRKPNTLWTDCGVTVAVTYCRWRYLYVTGHCHLRGPGQWGDPVRLLSSRQTLRHWGDQLRKSDILTTEMEYSVALVTSPYWLWCRIACFSIYVCRSLISFYKKLINWVNPKERLCSLKICLHFCLFLNWGKGVLFLWHCAY